MLSGCSFWPLGPAYELPLGAPRAKRAPKSLHLGALFSAFFWSSSVLDAGQGRKGTQGVPEGYFGLIREAFWHFFDIFQTLGMRLDLYRIISQWMFGCFAAQHQSV